MKLSQPGRAARTVAAAGLILFGVGVSHMVAQTYPLYQEPWRPQFHFSQPYAPQTYLVDGRQHLLIAVGDTLYAFTLY